jgi:hypothetical protein
VNRGYALAQAGHSLCAVNGSTLRTGGSGEGCQQAPHASNNGLGRFVLLAKIVTNSERMAASPCSETTRCYGV